MVNGSDGCEREWTQQQQKSTLADFEPHLENDQTGRLENKIRNG